MSFFLFDNLRADVREMYFSSKKVTPARYIAKSQSELDWKEFIIPLKLPSLALPKLQKIRLSRNLHSHEKIYETIC